MTTFILEQTVANYSREDLCERCGITEALIEEFIELGIIIPLSRTANEEQQFSAESYLRLHKAVRIQRDLAVNPPGVALAMDLLDKIDNLHKQLHALTDITLEK